LRIATFPSRPIRYWRSHDGLEVDLILQGKGKLVPVEVKLTTTPLPVLAERLKRFRALAGEENCEPGILVCRVTEEKPLSFGVRAIPWQKFPAWLKHCIG